MHYQITTNNDNKQQQQQQAHEHLLPCRAYRACGRVYVMCSHERQHKRILLSFILRRSPAVKLPNKANFNWNRETRRTLALQWDSWWRLCGGLLPAYLTQHSSLSSQIVKRKTGSNKQFNLKSKRG